MVVGDESNLIEQMTQTRKALLREADAVGPELRRTPFVGHWDLMDVLAHLVGWDYTNIDAIRALQDGNTPVFYAEYDPGWATFNAQLVRRYRLEDWDRLRQAIDDSQSAVTSVLRELGPEALTRPHTDPSRSRPITMAGVLRAVVRDEQEHLAQIQAFRHEKT